MKSKAKDGERYDSYSMNMYEHEKEKYDKSSTCSYNFPTCSSTSRLWLELQVRGAAEESILRVALDAAALLRDFGRADFGAAAGPLTSCGRIRIFISSLSTPDPDPDLKFGRPK